MKKIFFLLFICGLSLSSYSQTIQANSFRFEGKIKGKKVDTTLNENIIISINYTKITMISKSIGKITFNGITREDADNGLAIYGKKDADGSFYDYAEIGGNLKCERNFICSCPAGDITIECY